jgi:Fe-S-cluster containining protein
MSACDKCYAPGRCCSGMHINRGRWPGQAFDRYKPIAEIESSDWPWEDLDAPFRMRWRPKTLLEVYVVLATMFEGDGTSNLNIGPLMPLWRRPDGRWLFWCPVLTWEGRCGDHAHRPGLCRSYEPMADGLCVLASQKLDYREQQNEGSRSVD